MTEELKVELPELPEPLAYRDSHRHTNGFMGGHYVRLPSTDYTADQMRAYALQAVKEERERLFDELLAVSARWDWPVRELLKSTIASIRSGKQSA